MSTINWHADEHGRCFGGCEQYEPEGQPHCRCDLLSRFPWVLHREVIAVGSACPFAVLADVFRLHERPGKETP